jgi:hypothetical protein
MTRIPSRTNSFFLLGLFVSFIILLSSPLGRSRPEHINYIFF